MQEIIMRKKGEDSWVTWIKKRIKLNLNFLGIITGPTGSGKTYAGLNIAETIDKDFKIDYCVFDFREFMNLINKPEFKKKKGYKVIIFDEPQISMSNRNWQSSTNKLINYLLSTFRHQNIIVFFCCPYSDFLDAQSMKLIHAEFECLGVNKRKKISRLHPTIRQYNPNVKKTYHHRLKVIIGGKIVPLSDWYVKLPSKKIIDEYELKKSAFTSLLNKEIMQELNQYGGEGKGLIETTKRKPLTEIQEKVMRSFAENNNKASVVAEKLGMKLPHVYSYRKFAEKKGYKIEEFMPKIEDKPKTDDKL